MQLSILLCRSLPFIVITYVSFTTHSYNWTRYLKLYHLKKSSWNIGPKSYTYLKDTLLLISKIKLNKFLC